SHLERTGGGIGTRGPGETQLETDRRIISKRISELKRKLDEIEGRSQRQSASRDDVLSLSLVGYTNAGKSTIMRQLTGTDVYIADQLFATLDTKVRRWEMGNGRSVTLSDTVGFVRDLPHHLVASFHATLEETLQADLLLHVCDAASPDLEIHIRAVKQVLEVLEAQEIPTLLIFNKSDCLTEDEKKNLEKKWPDATFVSALTENSLQPLDARVSEIMDQWSVEVRVCVPAGDGRLIAEIRQVATILHEQWEVDEWQATLRLLPRHWNPLKGRVQSYS
ncbi:MAG: GTPase HflX, partial [Planctomycetota bacterium]|nr:GTPase HflX [Planctomycetota bacterium]